MIRDWKVQEFPNYFTFCTMFIELGMLAMCMHNGNIKHSQDLQKKEGPCVLRLHTLME
jgi:hypothetical protein